MHESYIKEFLLCHYGIKEISSLNTALRSITKPSPMFRFYVSIISILHNRMIFSKLLLFYGKTILKHPTHIQILATLLIPYKALMGGRPIDDYSGRSVGLGCGYG